MPSRAPSHTGGKAFLKALAAQQRKPAHTAVP
jgi:hypothetical protein